MLNDKRIVIKGSRKSNQQPKNEVQQGPILLKPKIKYDIKDVDNNKKIKFLKEYSINLLSFFKMRYCKEFNSFRRKYSIAQQYKLKIEDNSFVFGLKKDGENYEYYKFDFWDFFDFIAEAFLFEGKEKFHLYDVNDQRAIIRNKKNKTLAKMPKSDKEVLFKNLVEKGICKKTMLLSKVKEEKEKNQNIKIILKQFKELGINRDNVKIVKDKKNTAEIKLPLVEAVLKNRKEFNTLSIRLIKKDNYYAISENILTNKSNDVEKISKKTVCKIKLNKKEKTFSVFEKSLTFGKKKYSANGQKDKLLKQSFMPNKDSKTSIVITKGENKYLLHEDNNNKKLFQIYFSKEYISVIEGECKKIFYKDGKEKFYTKVNNEYVLQNNSQDDLWKENFSNFKKAINIDTFNYQSIYSECKEKINLASRKTAIEVQLGDDKHDIIKIERSNEGITFADEKNNQNLKIMDKNELRKLYTFLDNTENKELKTGKNETLLSRNNSNEIIFSKTEKKSILQIMI